MAARQDGFTDVLCLHQPVAVPPQLSDEGRYSVLMFFDTASVLFENPEQGGQGWGARVEGEGRGPVMPFGREEGGGVDQEGEDKRRERSRRQACHDLSKAMAILLSDGNIDVEDDLEEVKAAVSFNDSRERDNPSSTSRNSRILDGARRLEGKNPEGEAGDEDFGAEGEGDLGHRSSTLEGPSSLGLNCESDALSRDLQGELDGELLEARLARECGVANELRGDSFEDLALSDAPRTHGNGGQSEEKDVKEVKHAITREKEQHQQHTRPLSPSYPAVDNKAAEYSSGDESSAAPRVDLLRSPYRASTSARSALTAEEERIEDSSNGGTTVDETLLTTSCIPPANDSGGTNYGRSQEEAEHDTTMGKNRDEPGRKQQNALPGTMDGDKATATAKHEDATQSPMPRNLRLSLDGYEDDFCCDDEDESSSLARPEAEGEGSTGKSFDATADNNNNNNKFEGMGNRSGIVLGGNSGGVAGGSDDDYVADGYDSSTSDGVYSGTAAGGLEADLHGGRSDGVYDNYGNYDTSWGGSPEGRVGEGDVWGIRSPPRTSARNHPNISSRKRDRRKVHDGDDNHLFVSEETGRIGEN